MTGYALHDSSFFSRRTTALLFIVCLHAVLIYLLATGLMHTIVQTPPPVTRAMVLPGPHAPVKPPPPAAPKFLPTGIVEPRIPEGPIVPPDADTNRDQLIERLQRPTSLPLAPVVDRILGGPGKGFPDTDEFYPAASRRLGEQGIATVRVCIDGNGRLTASPTLAQSSGSARLDEGAVKLATAGSGHYRATTEDGHPISSCYPFRIRFVFRN